MDTLSKAVVDRKSKDCVAMIAAIKDRQAEAERKQKLAGETARQLKEDNIRIQYESEQAQKALADALPELEAAKQVGLDHKPSSCVFMRDASRPGCRKAQQRGNGRD